MSALGKIGARAAKLAASGRTAEAVTLWEAMHRRQPGDARIGLGLGAALLGAGRTAEAAQWLAQCCLRHQRDKDLARLYGQVLLRQDLVEPALGAFFHALSIDPACPATQADIANAFHRDRQSAAGLPYAEASLSANLSIENVSTYVCILMDLGHAAEALAFLERLMAADPAPTASHWLLRAAALQAVGRMGEGLLAAREALRRAPDQFSAQHNYAAALLLHGRLGPEAWQLYEARAALLEPKAWPAEHRRWTTQDIRGLTLLVHAEQGLGDTLQFIRYVPLLAQRCAKVVVAVQHPLVGLLQGTPGAAAVVPAGTLPPFDLYCPLLSLPGRLETTLETIPPPIPYALAAPPAPHGSRLQVGLVWAGRGAFVDDRKRSLDPALLAPLGAISDVDFHGLQLGAAEMPLPNMRDALAGAADFVDTAAQIAQLDLVIAVDTAVAHLAATMGKPVWLLTRHNGCWRWLLDRSDSPWYPTLRLFRQRQGQSWGDVVAEIAVALTEAAATHRDLSPMAA